MRQTFWPLGPRERNYAMLTASLAFLGGCLAAMELTPGAWLWALAGLGAAAGFALNRAGRSALAGAAVCLFALGVLHAQAALSPPQPLPGRYEITGTVYGGVELRDGERLTFTLSDITLDGEPAAGRAYCSLYFTGSQPQLGNGMRLSLEGRVYLPDGKSGDAHFDFRLWLYQNGMSFGITSSDEVKVLGAGRGDWTQSVRETFAWALQSTMGDEARVAMAMLFNERMMLSDEEYEAFKTLGVAHVLSVSGLHVGLVGSLLLTILRRLRVRRRVYLPLMGLALTAYCALSGFSAASIRAAAMLLIAAGGRLMLRRMDMPTHLSAAMLIVLILNPLDAHSAGFTLSFCAMLGIGLFNRPLRRLLGLQEPGRFRALRRGLAVSIAGQAGVLLPTAAYFHQLPLYGVLVNLMVVPLVGVLIPLYFVALACSMIPLLGPATGWAASALTRMLLEMVGLLSRLPFAALRVPTVPTALCVGLTLSAVALSRMVIAKRSRRLLAAAVILAVSAVAAFAVRPAPVRYIQLSVGQADAALLMDGGKTVAIDVGEDGGEVADYLLAEGRNLDALYLTHLHEDHAGGVQELLDLGIEIGQVYLPSHAEAQEIDESARAALRRLEEAGIPVSQLGKGDRQRYGQTSVEVLWPDQDARTGQDANELPLVLKIDLCGYTVLCASDLTGTYEAYAAAPCDVLKVAHHGSAYSTGEAFLAFARPEVALISCSHNNAYLPSPQTLERLEDAGVRVLRTNECGDITLIPGADGLRILPYRGIP